MVLIKNLLEKINLSCQKKKHEREILEMFKREYKYDWEFMFQKYINGEKF